MSVIASFRGPYWFLSNFSASVLPLPAGSAPTVEHAFQAAKCVYPECARQVLAAATPGDAKRLGRAMPLRPDWEAVKLRVMRDLLAIKFMPGSDLSAQLLSTGDAVLVEVNNWGDRYWGVSSGTGQNWLGHLLMARRAELRGSV